MGGCASKGEATPGAEKKAGGGGNAGGGAPKPKVDNTPKPFEVKITREDGLDAGEHTIQVLKTDKVGPTLVSPTGMDPYWNIPEAEVNGKDINPDDTFGGAGIAAGASIHVKGMSQRSPMELWDIVAADLCDVNKECKLADIKKCCEFNDDGTMKKILLNIKKISKLPDSFCSIDVTEDLNLRENALTELPKRIGDIKVAGTFRLASNKIKAIPDSMCDLVVGTLDFGHNKVKKLPDKFSEITCTRNLLMEYNDIKRFPPNFETIKVTNELHVYGNPLVGEKPKLGQIFRENGLSLLWNDPN